MLQCTIDSHHKCNCMIYLLDQMTITPFLYLIYQMEGEVSLVAGRSQREKRRSYKDLLREEEIIDAEVRKSSKKRPKVRRQAVYSVIVIQLAVFLFSTTLKFVGWFFQKRSQMGL